MSQVQVANMDLPSCLLPFCCGASSTTVYEIAFGRNMRLLLVCSVLPRQLPSISHKGKAYIELNELMN